MFAANLPVNIVERASLSREAVLIDGSKVSTSQAKSRPSACAGLELAQNKCPTFVKPDILVRVKYLRVNELGLSPLF